MSRLLYRTIAVSGSSMSPTYNDGDWLLFVALPPVVMGKPLRLVGKVVVIERENYPGIYFIKRVIRADKTGLWVEGDNTEASTDSRQWGSIGPTEIVGRILLRYKRRKPSE